MSKKRFIQAAFIRALPGKDKMDSCLHHAEQLWGYLTAHGYGDDKPSEPREGGDHYQSLDPRQRRFFDGFWQAFNHKHGRNNAARRWAQLGDKTDGEYQQIIDAAANEAKRERAPGEVRKMAEGWLFEQRWADYTPTQKTAQSAAKLALVNLENQLKGIKKLYDQSKDPALLPQIGKLENAIKEARK